MPVSNADRRNFKLAAETHEPGVVFRANDKHLPALLNFYIEQLEADDVSDDVVQIYRDRLAEVEKWQGKYEDRVGQPEGLRPGDYEAKR